MRVSRLISKKHKEKPAEAQLISHIYLLRGGYMRPVSNGIYSLLPPAVRVQAKIENIIREEMNKIDGQEVKMPVVMPRELWEESGRWENVGSELLRFKDRTQHDMLLGMTHEEAVTALARTEVTSYKDYPFMLYQILRGPQGKAFPLRPLCRFLHNAETLLPFHEIRSYQ